jgi:hypothetical protein
MALTRLVLTLLTLLSIATRGTTAWEVNLFSDGDCLALTPDGHGIVAGSGSTCLPYGGNSWLVAVEAGCSFYSWSGNNCRGSSVQEQAGFVDVCIQDTPFASIQIVC